MTIKLNIVLQFNVNYDDFSFMTVKERNLQENKINFRYTTMFLLDVVLWLVSEELSGKQKYIDTLFFFLLQNCRKIWRL